MAQTLTAQQIVALNNWSEKDPAISEARTGDELALGDLLSGLGQTTAVNFGESPDEIDGVMVSVADTGVVATSAVQATVSVDSTRASDEAEMDPMSATVGLITAGVGYDVYVSGRDGRSSPHGLYTLHTSRI